MRCHQSLLLVGCDLQPEVLSDTGIDLTLDRKYVSDIALVFISPKVAIGSGIEKLRTNHNQVTVPCNCSGQNRTNTQGTPRFRGIYRAITGSQAPRNHVDAMYMGYFFDDAAGEPVGQVIKVAILIGVDER